MELSKFTTLLLLWCSLGFHPDQSPKTGFYYLAENPSDGILVQDNAGEETYAIEKLPIVTAADFRKLKIAERDFRPEPMNVIEGQLNRCGKRKWAGVIERTKRSGETIVFVSCGKVITEYHLNLPHNRSAIDICAAKDLLPAIYAEMNPYIGNCK